MLEFSRIVSPIQYMRLIEHEGSLRLRVVRNASKMRTGNRRAVQTINRLKVRWSDPTHNRELPVG